MIFVSMPFLWQSFAFWRDSVKIFTFCRGYDSLYRKRSESTKKSPLLEAIIHPVKLQDSKLRYNTPLGAGGFPECRGTEDRRSALRARCSWKNNTVSLWVLCTRCHGTGRKSCSHSHYDPARACSHPQHNELHGCGYYQSHFRTISIKVGCKVWVTSSFLGLWKEVKFHYLSLLQKSWLWVTSNLYSWEVFWLHKARISWTVIWNFIYRLLAHGI